MNCEVKAENHKVLQMVEKFRGKLEQNVRKNEYNRDQILTDCTNQGKKKLHMQHRRNEFERSGANTWY